MRRATLFSRLRGVPTSDAEIPAKPVQVPPEPLSHSPMLDLQRDVVLAIAAAIPSDWTRITANFEIDFTHGQVEDIIIVYLPAGEDRSVLGSVEHIPHAVNKAFYALWNEAAEGAQKWSTAEVTIDEDGAYRFTFSYDPPKRINGVFDDDSYDRFSVYAARTAAERTTEILPPQRGHS